MAIGPRLEFRQSQQLVMTPQLMQAIKLLQLSNVDLIAHINNELESNPFLEQDDSPDGAGPAAEPSRSDGSTEHENAPTDAQEGDWLSNELQATPEAISSKLDSELSNVFSDDNGENQPIDPVQQKAENWQAPSHNMSSGGSDYNLEAFVAAEVSLSEHLQEQLGFVVSDPADLLVARQLIDCIDENGYLRIDSEEISHRLGVTESDLDRVISRIQGLDPVGVFARDLIECLKLQLIEKNRYDPAMQALVENIELLAHHDLVKLKRLCKVDDEDLKDMILEIKELNPKPGAAFNTEITQAIVPDAFVLAASDGGWTVELNTENLPKVLVNQSYYSEISQGPKNDKELAYFTDSLQTANWLVKSLDQRARTILKVSSEIVRQQDGFLTYGVQYLRPMNLRVVADAIGMHESTVSRVTSNKYIATPRGIFELKYFFSAAIASSEGGESHSAESVRYQIKQLIDAEDPKKILSDDALVKILKDDGVDIARRTVAKYREALKIPSSVQRRREKKLLA
ncbi:RNA polymerase sigma-54 factor 2 [Pseudovibrio axinellae]|uniref:RNA polymerase sigma-54 factor n=1 Tax=Pseudovibrio axinellae TaxID=989403 RepID=A0A165YZ91_9HYPH|nr:RNA polymerase factor sigma-54 [Pseudovibrio axinellae]KZL19369.1 RNA polymerase sigma-54 factor 2 [Pseudovibrio axinellae]SEQ39353.1 RNA polymerase, sigma 54 subunit, RpoN/SigL [Pseudovibrio axinellae]